MSDPITTAEYYGMAGIFKSTRSMEKFRVQLDGLSMFSHPKMNNYTQKT